MLRSYVDIRGANKRETRAMAGDCDPVSRRRAGEPVARPKSAAGPETRAPLPAGTDAGPRAELRRRSVR
ncbi:hypothetical protein NAEX_02395 [Nannocystis exedens]|nr:hypothetical protein NAEX_02395 [Nannocystis exedens]